MEGDQYPKPNHTTIASFSATISPTNTLRTLPPPSQRCYMCHQPLFPTAVPPFLPRLIQLHLPISQIPHNPPGNEPHPPPLYHTLNTFHH